MNKYFISKRLAFNRFFNETYFRSKKPMKNICKLLFSLIGGIFIISSVQALPFETADKGSARKWEKDHFFSGIGTLPFSFIYDGKSSAKLLPLWKMEISGERKENFGISRTILFKDPSTGLEIRCETRAYDKYPVFEWTLYFKNTGTKNTPVIENIRSLDTVIPGAKEKFVLNRNRGTMVKADDYEPLREELVPGTDLYFSPPGGRP